MADDDPTDAVQRYRERAYTAHPDRGGTDEMMMHVNRAREFALQEIRG